MLIPEDLDLELDEFVERFEVARAENPHVDVKQFMPQITHPRYAAIGCELLRVDMELSAATGRLLSVESYRDRFPVICQNSVLLNQLADEAKRLTGSSRANRSSPVNASFASTASNPAPPQPGQTVCGFRILAELGRGAFSWVFLATDASLSQRPVVLKFSAQFPAEAQLLSRLQHKNIVPIYSLHQWHQYHLLCMPFLGALTLNSLLQSDQPSLSKPLSGQALIDTLMTSASQTWKETLPATFTTTYVAQTSIGHDSGLSSQLQADVSRMTTTELALWIVAELADGLAHAHLRGILHRDIKPANVLLSDDGLPMLLDFNLAAETQPAIAAEQVVGGTLRYMAPEQLRAVQQSSQSLDFRTDIFSLGVVLYELLMLAPPFPDRTGNTRDVLQQMLVDRQALPMVSVDWKRGLTPAVINIVLRALAPLPAERYASAEQFRDDLRRQLAARPLQHTPDRSVRERIAKWNSRHPRLTSLVIVSGLSCVLLTFALVSAWIARAKMQRLAVVDWLQQVAQTEVSARNLLACQNAPDVAIEQWLTESETVLAREDQAKIESLNPEQQAEVKGQLARILFYRSQGDITLASRATDSQQTPLLQRALDELERSQSIEPSDVTKAWIDTIGQAANTAEVTSAVRQLPLKTVIDRELDLATRSVDRHATNPWHWLSMGQLHLYVGQLESARSNFELSHQLAQEQPLPAFFLGVVEMQRKNFQAADQWFSHALTLDPMNADVLLSRAATRVELKRYQQAIDDIDKLGASIQRYPRAWFIRERAESRLGRSAAAKRSLHTGLQLTPVDALGWNARGEARLRTSPPDPHGALHDFEKSIEVEPNFRNAYENAAHVLAEHLHQPLAAIDKLNQVVEVDPTYALALSSRAVLQARLGKAEAAQQDIAAALAMERTPLICYQAASALAILNKGNSTAGKSLAESGTQSGSISEALELLKEALRQDPKLNKLMQHDQDLLNLHDSPEFQQLLTAAKKLQ